LEKGVFVCEGGENLFVPLLHMEILEAIMLDAIFINILGFLKTLIRID